MNSFSTSMSSSQQYKEYEQALHQAVHQGEMVDLDEFERLYQAIPVEEKEKANLLRMNTKNQLLKEITEALSYNGIYTRFEEYLSKVHLIANIMIGAEEAQYWALCAFSLTNEMSQMMTRDNKMAVWEWSRSDGYKPKYGELNTEAILYYSSVPSRKETTKTIEEEFDECYKRFSTGNFIDKATCVLDNLEEYLWHFAYQPDRPDIKRFCQAYEMNRYFYGMKIDDAPAEVGEASDVNAAAAAAMITVLSKGQCEVQGASELAKTAFYFATQNDMEGCEKITSYALALVDEELEYQILKAINACKTFQMGLSPMLWARYSYLRNKY